MSWSFGVKPTPAGEFEEAIKAAFEEAKEAIVKWNPHGLPAAELATLAAIELISSGAVGTGKVQASLSGHGVNPANVGNTAGAWVTIALSAASV